MNGGDGVRVNEVFVGVSKWTVRPDRTGKPDRTERISVRSSVRGFVPIRSSVRSDLGRGLAMGRGAGFVVAAFWKLYLTEEKAQSTAISIVG
nr:hypothetical protein [Tanacetum cinerariifolium]